MSQHPREHKHAPEGLAPSVMNAEKILRRAVQKGTVTWTKRLLARCGLHAINMVDVVRVVSTGSIHGRARFDAANNGWRYDVVGLADGRKLKVEVLLYCEHDFDTSPEVAAVTACWWRGRVRASKE